MCPLKSNSIMVCSILYQIIIGFYADDSWLGLVPSNTKPGWGLVNGLYEIGIGQPFFLLSRSSYYTNKN